MDSNKLYNEKSIESLSPLEFTRLRPGVYAGDTTYSTQLLVEIVSNAVDEFRLGHGDRIDVKISNDVENAIMITVRDYGQGFIPNSFREDGKTILEAAFSVLNTSGKYREDGTYEGTSLGSFGIGSKITNYLSHAMYVETMREGMIEHITFKEGEFEHREVHEIKGLIDDVIGQLENNKIKVDLNKRRQELEAEFQTGTRVTWWPSEEFFTNTDIEIDKVKALFKTIACLCPGLTINLDYKGDLKVFESKHGLNDLADDAVKGKEIITNRFNMNMVDGKNKMDMILTYTSNYSSTLVPYVNTGLTEKGPHITQVKTILTREFNKFFKEKKWLKAGEENLTGDDIQEGMYIVFNITAPNVSYDAQVKSTITKIEMKPFTQALADDLQVWFNNNEKEIKMVADKAIAARKARDAAKKARDAVRENQKKKKEKVLKFDSKLADCFSKDRTKCEVYIVEGDSAAGTLKTARNNEFQAVMPVRGKIINTQKASLDKIQKNAEIMTMIEAFGLSIDPKNMKVTYDKEDLRYGKIIIMSDADVSKTAYERLFA